MTEVTSISVEILQGLAQLHAVNILHLDLKPAKILLDEYGHSYLAGFCRYKWCTFLHAYVPHSMAVRTFLC